MPVARRAAALPGSWDCSRSSSSWRAARGEIIHAPTRGPGCPTCGGRVWAHGPGGAWAAGGGSSVGALGRLRSSQVVVCGPTKAAAAPGFPPEARTKETRPGFPRFATPELDSESEQGWTDPR